MSRRCLVFDAGGSTVSEEPPAHRLVPLSVPTPSVPHQPNGIRLWVFPFETLFSSVQREFIIERFPPAPDQLVFWLLVGLVATGTVAIFLAPKRPSITELLVFGGTAVGAFPSARNVPIFAVASTPILCRHLAATFSLAKWTAADDSGESKGLLTLLAGGAIGIGAVAIAATTVVGNASTVRSTFPEAAVDWIESSDRAEARIFNTYAWGEYLIWRGHPVYIDGRADVYGNASLLDFVQTYDMVSGWEESLDRHLVDLVMAERSSRLAATLTETPGWELVYEDSTARVLERAG